MLTQETLQNKKTTLITAAILLVCFALFFFFPTNNLVELLTASLVFFFIIPVLYVRILLKSDLEQWGLARLQWNAATARAFIGPVALAAVTLALLLFSDGFVERFQTLLPTASTTHFGAFLIYVGVMAVFLFCVEYYFRGFLMPFLAKLCGGAAVWLQAIAASLFFLFDSSSAWYALVMFVFSLGAGSVAQKTRSAVLSFFYSFVFITLTSVFVISLTRS